MKDIEKLLNRICMALERIACALEAQQVELTMPNRKKVMAMRTYDESRHD